MTFLQKVRYYPFLMIPVWIRTAAIHCFWCLPRLDFQKNRSRPGWKTGFYSLTVWLVRVPLRRPVWLLPGEARPVRRTVVFSFFRHPFRLCHLRLWPLPEVTWGGARPPRSNNE